MRITEKYIAPIFIILFISACTIEFLPEIDKEKEQLVVEGMITDQDGANRIKLSVSSPIGQPISVKPVTGALVTITDEVGVVTALAESPPGTYSTDSTNFRGRVGGRYSLHIMVNDVEYGTDPIEMKPVPPINSLYYEKATITSSRDSSEIEEGCRIYVDSYDPTGNCLFFRWDYIETWEYVIPYSVLNKVCWITERSEEILIRNTSQYNQARITKHPVLFISNKTDRLKETYSILVNQYSLSEPEYEFWERIKRTSQDVGNLYDIIPMAIPGNIKCITYPGQEVLGYFSVSAVTHRRLFIHDSFLGLPHFYTYCATDTLSGNLPETGLNSEFWVIEDYGNEIPPFWVISTYKECADCSVRGTKVRPLYWKEF